MFASDEEGRSPPFFLNGSHDLMRTSFSFRLLSDLLMPK